MARFTKLMSAALCLSLIASVPGSAALAADCCRVETMVAAASAPHNQVSDSQAAVHQHGSWPMASAGVENRSGHGHESRQGRGLPSTSPNEAAQAEAAQQDSDYPAGQSFPVCGLSICAGFPQASLASQTLPGHWLNPESVVAPETSWPPSPGFLDSIFRPPRS